MSPLPGTVEAIVLIVFSEGNTKCSSLARDEPLKITPDRASKAQAEPRAFIVSAFMIVPLVATRAAPACGLTAVSGGKRPGGSATTRAGVPLQALQRAPERD